MLVLVLGGTRSGKSDVGEALAAAAGPPVTYLATGTATDGDMAARIAAHRGRRPSSWTTREVGGHLAGALTEIEGTVLVDALGTWLAQHADFDADIDGLCAALTARAGTTIVVSDEVGLGVHPSTELGRRFRDALGVANRAVADRADRVLLVVAGRVLDLPRLQELSSLPDPGSSGRPLDPPG